MSHAYFRSVALALADVAEALDHAHAAGILHRDVKPSNVMLDAAGHCWIIDFGLAGYLSEPRYLSEPCYLSEPRPSGSGGVQPLPDGLGSEDLAQASGVLGTSHYMAPEQFEGKADVRTDVWGLGVTLYQLMTLRRPFRGQTDEEIRTKILSANATPARALVANLPRDLAAICRHAMQREPARRYPTAGELAADLRRWLLGEPVAARPVRSQRRLYLWSSRNKGLAMAIAATVAACITVAVSGFVLEKERATAAETRARDLQHDSLIQQLQLLR